jgi:hypothetical protein
MRQQQPYLTLLKQCSIVSNPSRINPESEFSEFDLVLEHCAEGQKAIPCTVSITTHHLESP